MGNLVTMLTAICEEFLELRTIVGASRFATIGEQLGYIEAMLVTIGPQFGFLQREGLVIRSLLSRADPDVKNGLARHGVRILPRDSV